MFQAGTGLTRMTHHPFSDSNLCPPVPAQGPSLSAVGVDEGLPEDRRDLFQALLGKATRLLSTDEQARLASAIAGLPTEALATVRERPPGVYRFNGAAFCVTGYNLEDLGNIRISGNTQTGQFFDDVVVSELTSVPVQVH